MADEAPDTVDAYRDYLARFEKDVGAVEFGTYVKHNNRLIKKLTYDEFDPKWRELCEVNAAYDQIVANGDTINDVLVKVLRERSDELLLERKI
jgi:hypothetical protein